MGTRISPRYLNIELWLGGEEGYYSKLNTTYVAGTWLAMCGRQVTVAAGSWLSWTGSQPSPTCQTSGRWGQEDSRGWPGQASVRPETGVEELEELTEAVEVNYSDYSYV